MVNTKYGFFFLEKVIELLQKKKKSERDPDKVFRG